ncbi:hypothetical protein M3Y96_00337300 [Aphelenchoides besseyi]|nr:hypothetical protein M3Y96_00337300 [Aphelenchoides besseyi]
MSSHLSVNSDNHTVSPIVSRQLKRQQSSISSLDPPNEIVDKGWVTDPTAWNYFCSLTTTLYAIFIVVFAMILELASMAQKLDSDDWFVEMLFYSYMYGIGILFLLYFYFFHIYPINFISAFARRHQWISGSRIQKAEIRKDDQPSGAGSLYLRLGMLCFGSSAVILFSIEIIICSTHQSCFNYKLVNWVLACTFTFFQMHFIFCNSKIIINESKNLVKLGCMHLLGVNLWTWVRFVVAKHEGKALFTDKYSKSTIETIERNDTDLWSNLNVNSSVGSIFSISTFNYFGDFATLLTTCIVEYSVICAAIMIVLHRSIDNQIAQRPCTKRRHKLSIDCSASSAGLFAGVLFLICSLVALGIYTVFSQQADDHGALLVFRLSDFGLFCFALCGSIGGLYRMRSLHYYHKQPMSSNAEFLDEILLVVGLVGELVHSSTGLMCWISTQSEYGKRKMETYMLVVFVVREIQVIVQTIFILVSSRLRARSSDAVENKPGKQFVTFLLIANLALFFFHTLEGMTSVFGSALESRRTKPYATLICTVAPLVVFYRFHSSVCLAEIWKLAYSAKNRTPFSQQTSIDSAELPSEYSNSIRSSIRIPTSQRHTKMLIACIFYGVIVFILYNLFWFLLDQLTISSIEKKSVFITGCDSGFGNLTVFKCLKHGMTVFAGCLTEEGKRKLEEKATRERLPGLLHAISLDVSSDESVSEAVKYVQSVIGENGQLHGLVNNAGVVGTNMWDDWTELADYRHCFEINTLGLIRVTHAFKPFIKRARGRIVNTASICGRVALPCLGPYTISKYGVEAYSDTIRAELALYNVRVSIVEPGFFTTALTSAECQTKKLDEKWEKLNDDIKKEYGKHMVEFSKSTASQQLHLLCSSDLYLVANAYFHALTSRYSRRRYKVGNDSVYFFVPFSFLPGLLQDSFYSLIATLTKMPKPAIFQQH